MQNISASQLRAAVDRAGLPSGTLERIQAALVLDTEVAPGFQAAHISYYLGALLIIGAMGWFVTSSWDRLLGSTLTAIACGYGVLFGVVGVLLFYRGTTRIPGGLMVAVAVTTIPVAAYGLERSLGWWPQTDPGSYTHSHPYINASWVLMEVATIAGAGIALRFIAFPFLTAPAAYAAWYLSMDSTALFFGAH